MEPIKALDTVRAALNAATEKGVFGDLKTAFVLFQCLETIEISLKQQDGNSTNSNNPSE